MSRARDLPVGGRMVRFVIVGAGATLLLFALTYAFLRVGLPAFAAGAAAYAIAFAAAYTAQREWTFGGRHSHRTAFPRYLTAQLACAATASLVGHLCAQIMGLPPLWVSLAVTATAGAMSYLLSSRWVFAETRSG